ncbi:MAG: hypothetical protein V4665_02700 [Patescibacteria group bacterium]
MIKKLLLGVLVYSLLAITLPAHAAVTDSGCDKGTVYSDTTGQKCPTVVGGVKDGLSTVQIPASRLSVDLKVNASDNPSPVLFRTKINASWTSSGVAYCSGSGNFAPLWPGNSGLWGDGTDAVLGSKDLMAALAYNGDLSTIQYVNQLELSIQCWDRNGRETTDKVIVPVIQTVTPVPQDLTPRIAYWRGKVNQHMDVATGQWQSDPDGVSGANIDKLTYCRKWYPNTARVEPYMSETITTWKRAAGYEQSNYTNTVVSDKCVEGKAAASVKVISPNGGETFVVNPDPIGLNPWINFKSTVTSQKTGTLHEYIVQYPNANNYGANLYFGSSNHSAPNAAIDSSGFFGNSSLPSGQYYAMAQWKSNDGTENIVDFSDAPFTIRSLASSLPSVCGRLATPSITVLSPNGGETFVAGQKIEVKWKSCNIPANERVSIQIERGIGINDWSQSANFDLGATINDGSETFTVPTFPVYGRLFRVSMGTINLVGAQGDRSDSAFTITKDGSGYPTGCTSSIGYSSTTGMPCTAPANPLPPGCTSSMGYSVTTGQPCSGGNSGLPAGCTSSVGYSPITGVPCGTPSVPLLPGCSSTQGYSTTTGQPCSGRQTTTPFATNPDRY